MSKPINILVADDHPLLLEGIVSVIEKNVKNVTMHKAFNGADALQKVFQIKPDITILDIEMPLLNGIEVARKIKASSLKTKIIFLTLHKDQNLFKEINALDIDGYVLKEFSINEIAFCVNAVLNGTKYYSKDIEEFVLKAKNDFSMFTKTERNIIKLIAKEKTTKEIAEMLFVSTKTVDAHRYNICKKLNLKPEKNSLLKWVLQNTSSF